MSNEYKDDDDSASSSTGNPMNKPPQQDSILPGWWRQKQGLNMNKGGGKRTYIAGREVGLRFGIAKWPEKETEQVTFHKTKISICEWPGWGGTITPSLYKLCILNMLVLVIIFILYEDTRTDYCSTAYLDGTQCRPKWFSEILAPLEFLSRKITEVGVYVLAGYLAHSYARYRAFYWNARAVQDAITNLALNVSTLCRMNDNSKDFELLFERYLNLVNVLCYVGSSEARSTSKLMYELLPNLESLMGKAESSGSGRKAKDKEKDMDVLGLKLLTEEEKQMLTSAQNIHALEPVEVVLTWMSVAFDNAVERRALRESFYMTSEEEWTEPTARSAAQCLSFVKNLEALRTAVAAFKYHEQLPLPVAYTHLMQFIADVICVLAPFSVFYAVNNLIVTNSGFETSKGTGALLLCMVATGVETYTFQGMMTVAKLLSFPFGYATTKVRNAHITAPELLDHLFHINIPSLLLQTRVSTYIHFNVGRAISPPPITRGKRR